MPAFRRKVFYVGGFDPRGVRFYYGLLRDQLARWSGKTGEATTISPRRNVTPTRSDWQVTNEAQGTQTDYSFLRWEDLVQRAWIRSPLALARRAAGTYADHRRLLDLATLRSFPRGPLFTLFYPPVLGVAIPLLIALAVFGLGAIVLPWWAALLLGVAVAALATRPILTRIHAPWLLRFFVFNGDLSKPGSLPEIDERLDRFADEIERELDGDWDEVLLVTHSNGSILSVSLMARLLARRGMRMPARFALVTLGHCIPLVACRRDAGWFHEQLRVLGRGDFRWVDIGSPPDGAAYCQVDPMAIVGAEGRPRLDMLSPRFHRFYEPETYHKGWANKYEIHFDYLRVGDRVSPLDFPSLLANARPIDAAIAAFKTID